jgi:predicted nucleic-acid-binding protein
MIGLDTDILIRYLTQDDRYSQLRRPKFLNAA